MVVLKFLWYMEGHGKTSYFAPSLLLIIGEEEGKEEEISYLACQY